MRLLIDAVDASNAVTAHSVDESRGLAMGDGRLYIGTLPTDKAAHLPGPAARSRSTAVAPSTAPGRLRAPTSNRG